MRQKREFGGEGGPGGEGGTRRGWGGGVAPGPKAPRVAPDAGAPPVAPSARALPDAPALGALPPCATCHMHSEGAWVGGALQ